MGKFRVRSKSAKKGVRWAKGKSSESNPSKHKHRDAAKSKSIGKNFANGTGAGGMSSMQNLPNKLTAEAIMKHNALLGNTDDAMGGMTGDDEALTLGGTVKTFDTFASDWTQCTHTSFTKILRRFNPNNPQHKEMLAILAAITEEIKSRGGEETSTEYFSSFLFTLETVDTAEGLTATMTLLGLVIKTVPPAVLQTKFGVIAKVFMDHLAKHGAEGGDQPTSVVRSLIGCLAVLLRAQSLFTWKQSSTLQVYQALLTFIAHSKPKIRKAGQHAVCSIIKGSLLMTADNPPDFHPAINVTVKECLAKLDYTTDVKSVLYTLVLLKDIVGAAPQSQVKLVCDAVLSLMQTKAHPNLNSCSMQLLYGLFNSRPSEKSLSPDLNARLVTALNDFKPSVNDPQPFIAWLTVMQEALLNLSEANHDLALQHFPRFFAEAKKGWESDKKQVATAATTAMKAILLECIAPHIEEYIAETAALKGKKKGPKIQLLEKTLTHAKEGFGYQYHTSYTQVNHLHMVFWYNVSL